VDGTDAIRVAERHWWSVLHGPYSIRTQLLLVLFALTSTAWVIGGGLTILHARKATHIEINAAMELAEALVRDAITFVQHSNSPDRALASIPDQVSSVRHVRISVISEPYGSPLPLDGRRKSLQDREARAPAPEWFVELIAPPLEHREVPVIVDGKRLGSIIIESAPGDETAEVWENATSLGELALLSGVISLTVLYTLFGRVLAPLRSFAEGLRDLSLSDYNVRLPKPKAYELWIIVQRFNALASALEAMTAKNRRLSMRLITVQDDERRQTAIDLHDEVGPYLFGLRANANSIANNAKNTVAEIRAREMLVMIDALQSINRSVLNRLRPMALGQVPLDELLSSLVKERSRQTPDISIGYSANNLRGSYGEAIDVTLYRCIQESLTNVVRHAKARHAKIALVHEYDGRTDGREDARLILTVVDDGCGIRSYTSGLGIRGMQERVEALGGSFHLDAPAGYGTTVRIEIPVSTEDELKRSHVGSLRHGH